MDDEMDFNVTETAWLFENVTNMFASTEQHIQQKHSNQQQDQQQKVLQYPNILSTTAPPSPLITMLSSGRVQIPLYTTILLLAVIGNSLVILTLVQNRRMRTITNVFLLNLAVSDILLGVLCMPFTLVGMLLRDFVFGEIMCKFLPYLQGMY